MQSGCNQVQSTFKPENRKIKSCVHYLRQTFPLIITFRFRESQHLTTQGNVSQFVLLDRYFPLYQPGKHTFITKDTYCLLSQGSVGSVGKLPVHASVERPHHMAQFPSIQQSRQTPRTYRHPDTYRHPAHGSVHKPSLHGMVDRRPSHNSVNSFNSRYYRQIPSMWQCKQTPSTRQQRQISSTWQCRQTSSIQQ